MSVARRATRKKGARAAHEVGRASALSRSGGSGGHQARALQALCRAAVYRVLALGFSQPDAALVAALHDGEFVGELEDALAVVAADESGYAVALGQLRRAAGELRARPAAELLQELRVEHARLFTGPGLPAVAGHESEYLELRPDGGRGRLYGACSAAVAAAYLEEGVALSAGLLEPPDSAAAELEFLYHLCRCEASAWGAGEAREARRSRGAADRFLAEHAGRWLPAFVAAVRATTVSPLYMGLAALLKSFLEQEERAGAHGSAAPGPSARGLT